MSKAPKGSSEIGSKAITAFTAVGFMAFAYPDFEISDAEKPSYPIKIKVPIYGPRINANRYFIRFRKGKSLEIARGLGFEHRIVLPFTDCLEKPVSDDPSAETNNSR